MPSYFWKGVQPNGNIVIGQHIAKNHDEIKNYLASADITPIKITREHSFLIRNMVATDVLNFTQQLASLLQANVPLTQALFALSSSQKNQRFKAVIQQIQKYIEAGMNLSQATHAFPHIFNEEYRMFLKAGETTGHLSKTLKKLFVLLKQKKNIKHETKKIISYPIFLLTCALLTALGSVFYIIPKYQQFFSELGGNLPLITKILLNIAAWAQKYFSVLLLSLILFFFSAHFIRRSPQVIYWIHRYFLTIPPLRSLIVHATLSQWCYLLAIASRTNVPMLSAIELANQVIPNKYLKQMFSRIPKSLINGAPLYDCLKKIQFLPAMTLQMVLIGENTGTLAMIFSKIASHHWEAFTEQLTRMIKYAEPLIMILLALLTGMIIAALYLPMIHIGLEIRS